MAERKRKGGRVPHGYGSVSQRKDGRFQFSYLKPDGSRGYEYFAARSEAEAARTARIAAVARGEQPKAPTAETMAAFLRRWLEDVVKPMRRRNTWVGYRSHVETHLIPAFGRTKLRDLRPDHLQRLYREMLRKELSPNTVRRVHATLHGALRYAVETDLIGSNPAGRVRLPSAVPFQAATLSEDEVRRVLATADAEGTPAALRRLRPLWRLALDSGARESELLGLRWPDLDLEQRTVRFHAGLHRHPGGGAEIEEMKNEASERTIVIAPQTADALRQWRAVQGAERLRAGSGWRGDGLVFTVTVGSPVNESKLLKQWYQLCDLAGVPRVRIHDIRHTVATLLLQAGVPYEVVQRRLGHKQIGTTLNIYRHVVMSEQRDAAAVMARIMG